MDSLLNFLMFALPGGFVGSVFTWLVGRREHNNDMLSKLQASINMLSDENRKILAENIQLRRENANLQANQEEILQKQRALLKEVEHLRTEISKLTSKKNNETINQRGNPYADSSRGASYSGMRGTETHGERNTAEEVINHHIRIPRHTGERPAGDCDNDDHRPEGTTDDLCRNVGGDCFGVGDAECADTEPP